MKSYSLKKTIIFVKGTMSSGYFKVASAGNKVYAVYGLVYLFMSSMPGESDTQCSPGYVGKILRMTEEIILCVLFNKFLIGVELHHFLPSPSSLELLSSTFPCCCCSQVDSLLSFDYYCYMYICIYINTFC